MRTFHDDVARATGGSAQPAAAETAAVRRSGVSTPDAAQPASARKAVPKTPSEESTPPKSSPANAKEKVTQTRAKQEVAQASAHVPEKHASHLEGTEEQLDIRKEAKGKQDEGTIVRETKRSDWSLGRAISDSLNEMFSGEEEVRGKGNAPAATRRGGVEKSALSKLRTLAADTAKIQKDSPAPAAQAKVPERPAAPPIKQARKRIGGAKHERVLVRDVAPEVRERSKLQQPLDTLKDETTAPVGGPKITDDMREDAVEELLAAAVAEPAETDTAPRSEPPEQTAPQKAPAPEPEQTPKPKEDAAPSRDIPFTVPTFADEEAAPLRTYRNDAIEDIEENQRSAPEIAAAQAQKRRTEGRPEPKPQRPARPVRPFAIAALVMVVIIAAGGIGAFVFFGGDTPTGQSVRIPTFIAITDQQSVSFSENRGVLLEQLAADAAQAGTGIVQLYPIADDGQSAVPAADFFRVLDPRAPGSFVRALEPEMMLGAADTVPFMALKASSFENAFAGMLDWEPYMSADLAPFFGEPVRRSIDPTARTRDSARNAFFVDETIGNVDVRTLYDEFGNARIVYGFPDRETILIAGSTDAFATLVERYR